MPANVVSRDECSRIIELREQGMSVEDVAEQLDRQRGTIKRHCERRCRHFDKTRNNYAPPRDELAEKLARLGEKLQAIPTTDDWHDFEECDVGAKTVAKAFGGTWRDAYVAAGMPGIASDSPYIIRAAAYQIPWLTESPEERYQAEKADQQPAEQNQNQNTEVIA